MLSIYGVIPALRIVPDNTTFHFMDFRRISFPASAVLTIIAITLYFTHGLNFGIDFKGGTLLEIQTKTGPADIAALRAQLGTLNLGEVQLQQFGGPSDVLIRIAEQPGGDTAQQAAVQRCGSCSATASTTGASRWSARACPANCSPTAWSA